jgi:hypothetical protein
MKKSLADLDNLSVVVSFELAGLSDVRLFGLLDCRKCTFNELEVKFRLEGLGQNDLRI